MEDADLAPIYETKSEVYETFGNGVVLSMVQDLLPAGGRLLDIGCASGGLLALLRGHAGYLAGLEVSASAAERARKVADEVVVAGIEDPSIEFEEGSFDVVVLADVLEHLPTPESALDRALRWVRPGGWIVVSVPNVVHWSARLAIGRGDWRSEASGLFDATHLRYFNEQRLRELMALPGLGDLELRPVVPALRNHAPFVARLPRSVGAAVEQCWQALGRRFPNLFGYQLVACGRRSS